MKVKSTVAVYLAMFVLCVVVAAAIGESCGIITRDQAGRFVVMSIVGFALGTLTARVLESPNRKEI